jgi:replicative DNA helicase
MTVTEETLSTEEESKIHFDFDAGFQSKIAALCLRDTSFLQRVDGLIEPHYLENTAEAALVNIATRYFRKYKLAPADEDTLKRLVARDIMDKVIKKELALVVLTHAKDVLFKADISDRDLVVDEVASFARHQAIAGAIFASVDHLEKRNFDQIQTLLQKAMNVGVSSDHGIYSYGDMIEGRTEERLEKAAGRGPVTGISTGYKEIDKHLLHRGWGIGELSVLMGGAKAGKSTALINFGINAAAHLHRYNVLYVTLELGAKIIADRMDASISNHLMFELGLNIHDVKDKVVEWRDRAGCFHTVEFPTGTMKPSDLRRIIERKKSEGIKYDLVIVDYADLMAPDRYTDSSIENSKSIYAALRGIAMKESIALLTATQTNREGAKAAVAKMTDVSDDFNKVRIADLVISINKTDEERASNIARLFLAACRNGPQGYSITIKQDIDRMRFCTEVVGVA